MGLPDEPRRKKGEKIGTEERMEGKVYYCVFYPKIPCPIRTTYKLKPESLSPFCAACANIYIASAVSRIE